LREIGQVKINRFLQWRIFTWLILLLAGFWIWISAVKPGSTTNGLIPAPRPGFLAPDFHSLDINNLPVTLSEMKGRPVLLNFWASWCSPCKAEMPAMQRVYADFENQGFIILAVNATQQDNVEDVVAFIHEYQLSFPIVFDTDGTVSRLYAVNALPTSFFIDADGIIREVIVGGPMSEALLRVRVEQLLESE
jgi:thiol-disulfide isomerase/thioredoxin